MEKSVGQMFKEMQDNLDNKYGKGKWHCEDLLDSKTLPDCVQKFVGVHRACPIERMNIKEEPTLFANYEGKRVRVTMASRFGDVGITYNLDTDHGYDLRVYLPDLSDFSTKVR
jgi:hypothetical protein